MDSLKEFDVQYDAAAFLVEADFEEDEDHQLTVSEGTITAPIVSIKGRRMVGRVVLLEKLYNCCLEALSVRGSFNNF